MALTLVVHVHANPGQEEALFASLQSLLQPTRAEAGCLQYDLHRDNTDPAHFVFYEVWETPGHLQAHLKTPHIAAHQAATGGMVASAAMHELTKV